MKHGLHGDLGGIKQQVAEGICENAVRDLSFQAIKLSRVAQAPMCRRPEDAVDGPAMRCSKSRWTVAPGRGRGAVRRDSGDTEQERGVPYMDSGTVTRRDAQCRREGVLILVKTAAVACVGQKSRSTYCVEGSTVVYIQKAPRSTVASQRKRGSRP